MVPGIEVSVLGLSRACLLLLQKGVEVPRVRYETVHVQPDRPERTPIMTYYDNNRSYYYIYCTYMKLLYSNIVNMDVF
jgi:hypothetical protein